MGTRAAAFSAKIKSLSDTQTGARLTSTPSNVAAPSGQDLATAYKWFSSTLLSILKDVPGMPYHMIKNPERDSERLSLFPNLDYRGLYDCVYEFIPDLHLVTSSTYSCGKALLTLLASLFPFMDRATIEDFPYNMTELVQLLPVSLCHETVDVLCVHILPFILNDNVDSTCKDYIPAVLQTVLQKSPHDTAVHRKLMEVIMTHKSEVHIDLLHVVAYGPTVSKVAAANLLFFYWPSLNPTPAERKDIAYRFSPATSWVSPVCSNTRCPAEGVTEATKMCLDHSIPLSQRADLPPPAFYCADCADKFALGRPKPDGHPLFEDINLPVEHVDLACGNKNCRSTEKMGAAICFTPECTSYNSHRPIMYCSQCDGIRHNSRRGDNHVLQRPLVSPWLMKAEDREVLKAAVISLLSLARPFGCEISEETRTMSLLDDDEDDEEFSFDDYLMASRYGVWLLEGLFKPKPEDDAREVMGLLSMLFEWYKVTATLPNDKSGARVEKIKSDFLPSWLTSLYRLSPDIFVQCLIPEPCHEARVGGHWEISAPETFGIKEGLTRLSCLLSFDIITLDLWTQIAPHWMMTIVEHYSKENIKELAGIFCKIFDPDMSPLAFELDEMYRFMSLRLERGELEAQREVVIWLQTLCNLGVIIPLDILFPMYTSAIVTMDPVTSNNKGSLSIEQEEDIVKGVQILTCMLDVLIVQLQIQDVEPNVGMNGNFTLQTLTFSLEILSAEWLDDVIKSKISINYCEKELQEYIFILTQLLRNLLSHMLNEDPLFDSEDDTQNTMSTANTLMPDDKKDIKRGPGLGGFMAVLSSTFKTTVEKVQDDSDSDSTATFGSEQWPRDEMGDITDHPRHTQLMTRMFILLSHMDDPEIIYYILDILKSLALNEDCLYETSRKYKKLFCWLQHNHVVPAIWKILDSSHSEVALIAVPLLLTSLTLPHGADIFWNVLDDDFNHEDWEVRFAAVEKATLMFRFLVEAPLKRSQALRSVLAHALCHLISSMDDKLPQVAQRATIYLGTVHDKALIALRGCLEDQFDIVPEDRPIILKNLYQLFNTLLDRHILTWEFFANRFESIIHEIQETKLEDSAIPEPTPNANHATPNGIKENAAKPEKNERIRPRSGTDSIRSLVQKTPHPYKRTYSAPAGMVLNAKNKIIEEEKSNDYKRQQSAPPLRKRASRPAFDTNTSILNRLGSQSGNLSDENDLKDLAVKSLEIDEVNKETLHLLVFLFMHFLSFPNQTTIPENKSSVVNLAVQRSFHILYSLIGYDEVHQSFTTVPHKVRTSAQFCSFFATLPQVMDNNFTIGNLHIANFVMILQRSPFPPQFATNWIPSYSIIQENLLYHGCGYTLWYLEPIVRKNWLDSCLVLVYKYNFSEPEQLGEKVLGLMRIIINSLSAHVHVCSKLTKCEPGMVSSLGHNLRSQEMSENSIGFLGTATLQGTEENSAFNSRTSPTSNKRVYAEDDNSDKVPDSNSELETIFENSRSEPASSGNGSGSAKHNHENPLFFDLLPQARQEMKAGWLPEDQKLHNEGLPDGWSMQTIDSGRVLFVNAITGEHTLTDPRTGKECYTFKRKRGPFFSSPPSPLSLMDVLTVGSTAERDMDKETLVKNVIEEHEELEEPNEERLLPIGGVSESRRGRHKSGKHQHMSLLDRVWQVLGTTEDQDDCLPLVGREVSSQSKIKIATSDDNILESVNSNSVLGVVNKEDKVTEECLSSQADRSKVKTEVPNGRQRKIGISRGEIKEDEPLTGNVSDGSGSRCRELPQFQAVTQQSRLRIGEDTVTDRCSECGAIRERYTESELSLALVVINTFVHRDPQLAAPLLPEIFMVTSRIARKPLYSWESEGSLTVIPGNPRSVARQFLRVCLQQLSSNGVFPLLFQLDLAESQRKLFYSTIVSCLHDFTDLSPTVPVQLFFENLGSSKQTLEQTLTSNLPNLICYLSFIQYDHTVAWAQVFTPLESFFRSLSLLTVSKDGKMEKMESLGKDLGLNNIGDVMKLAVYTMKMNGINNHRSILDPISKVVSYAIQFCTFHFQAFIRDRDRSCIIRTVIAKFIEALRYKTSIPDVNFLYLASIILQDAKGELPPNFILDHDPLSELNITGPIYTGSTPWLEQYLPDIVEFVADVHTLGKVKSHVRGMTVGLNQDTLGGILKAALSQFLALEIARMSADKSESKITKYMPWLFNPPNTITTQGPKEFLDCVSHIRLLSWLLLGAMSHTMMAAQRDSGPPCQPIPLEASCHIADHIEVILAGFAEQSKTSVVHMCSLFHSFILSQLWTVYLEYVTPTGNTKEEQLLAPSILLDFWVKVTPGILQLVSHSKVLAEMVNLHFLSLMEALMECRSTILAKLMPLWCPVLHAYNINLPDHIRVRLQSIHDSAPQRPHTGQERTINTNLLAWLQRLQFKMGQIELQASNATQQFFTV